MINVKNLSQSSSTNMEEEKNTSTVPPMFDCSNNKQLWLKWLFKLESYFTLAENYEWGRGGVGGGGLCSVPISPDWLEDQGLIQPVKSQAQTEAHL